MADFVLVHGAWHGGWCWQKLRQFLNADGHRVHAITLTGLGDRFHLMSNDITVDTHIDDVIAVLETEGLKNTIMVGHSYGGMVVTGVAQRAHQNQISKLIYVDAVLVESGETWSSAHPHEVKEERREIIRKLGVIPPPDPLIFGLHGDNHAWVKQNMTPHPGGCYDSPLHFDLHLVTRWPRHYIRCNNPKLSTIEPSHRMVDKETGWILHDLSTGHSPMISAPKELAEILESVSDGEDNVPKK